MTGEVYRWHRIWPSLALAWLTAVAGIARSPAADPAPAGPAPAAARRVPATLTMGRERHKVMLAGRRDDKVLFSYAEASAQAVTAVSAADIQAADLDVELDREALQKATKKQDWAAAAAILYRGVQPALPFLDLKKNDLLPLALRTGSCLMKAGTVKSNGGRTAKDRALAQAEFRTALAVFDAVGTAAWSPLARTARLQSAVCLVLLDRLDDADQRLKAAPVPFAQEEDYGLYHLARAYLLVGRFEYQNALDAAIQAVLTETKDPDAFPDASLVSARCYEGLEDWFRARDVYYEVARLFRGTLWGRLAEDRLRSIMAEGLTRDRERARVETVFFGLKEDVNAKVAELLGLKTGPAPDEQKKEK